MRGHGQMVEVRTTDLAFTLDEARTLFGHPAQPDRATGGREDWIARLHQRTEGWAVGLRFAKLSLQDQHNAGALPAAFNGAHRYVMDFLIEEVLGHQSPELQSFLLTAAVTERFCAPLCDELRDPQDRSRLSSEDALAYLDQHSLFLIALDDEGRWFRFHHLFCDLLLHRLGRKHPAPLVESLHLRASAWFEGQGYLEEAIRHCVLAGQPARAARIVERHGGALLERVLAFAPEVEASSLPRTSVRWCISDETSAFSETG
jgi:LuxR family maltose regulon positive regulatory protein